MRNIVLVIGLCLTLFSCSSVKEYEKEKINDVDMKLSARPAERFETNYQVYREASSGANGGKTGGGCGCN
jgi:predicted component of type VI protein secretion system